MTKHALATLIALIVCAAAAHAASKQSGSETASSQAAIPRGFVHIKTAAPGIIEDMRYASPRNFTGAPVPGYVAGRCILARPVARALARVQAAVSAEGYALKVYDCYRPMRAVRAFVRWASRQARAAGPETTKHYYPRIARHRIIPLGYIAKRSSHALGTAIDLTLVRKLGDAEPNNAAPQPQRDGDCTAPEPQRPADNSIDMGTAWDCFDINSHTHSSSVPAPARANRRRLLRAMQAEGFRNYAREWWHFSKPLKNYHRAHDFPVR